MRRSGLRRPATAHVALSVLPALALLGCALTTAPDDEVANVLGTWSYVGTQGAPSLQLEGTLVISSQVGENVAGSLSWVERDGGGEAVVRAGQVLGMVLGTTDIDVDVVADDGTRRHVGRIAGDTLDGVWAGSGGRSGSFTAIRQAP